MFAMYCCVVVDGFVLQVLATMRSHLGNDHPHVAQTLALLGQVLRDTGRLEEALPLHEEV